MGNNNSYLIIGHNDMDGYMSTYLQAYKYMNECKITLDDIDIYNIDYGDIDELFKQLNLKQYSRIIIVDLNLTEEQADFIHNEVAPKKYDEFAFSPHESVENYNESWEREKEENYRNKHPLRLIDHHISGKAAADKYFWYHLDTSKSSTMLVYESIEETTIALMSKIDGSKYDDYIEDLVKSINAADIFDKSNMQMFRVGRIISKMQKEVECKVKSVMPFFSNGDKWNKFKLVYHNFIQEIIMSYNNACMLQDLEEENRLPYDFNAMKTGIIQNTVVKLYHKALDLKNFNIDYPTMDEYEVILLGESIVENYPIIGCGEYSIHRYFSSSYDKGTSKITPLNILIVHDMELNNMSDVADYIISDKYNKYNMVVFKENDGVWSFYCSDEFNVSDFCKKYGGGGHKRAAGVKLDITFEPGVQDTVKKECDYMAELIMKFYEKI